METAGGVLSKVTVIVLVNWLLAVSVARMSMVFEPVFRRTVGTVKLVVAPAITVKAAPFKEYSICATATLSDAVPAMAAGGGVTAGSCGDDVRNVIAVVGVVKLICGKV